MQNKSLPLKQFCVIWRFLLIPNAIINKLLALSCAYLFHNSISWFMRTFELKIFLGGIDEVWNYRMFSMIFCIEFSKIISNMWCFTGSSSIWCMRETVLTNWTPRSRYTYGSSAHMNLLNLLVIVLAANLIHNIKNVACDDCFNGDLHEFSI